MFNRLFSLCVCLACAFGVIAQSHFSIKEPEIEVYLPSAEKADGRLVLILPGGGYTVLASDYEGTDWSTFFNDKGIAVAVLNYKMPNGNPAIPMTDVKNTIGLIKKNAEKWNVNPDKIGIMGSSAGGHLASLIATDNDPENTPAFQILCYPVISMDKTMAHPHSHNQLLGIDASPELEAKYSSEKRAAAGTPRAFIAFSDDDDMVSPLNGTEYYKALRKNGVPASLHIYPTGGHGWGFKPFEFREQMLSDLSAWLDNFK